MRASYILWCIVFITATWSCKQDAAAVQENTPQAPVQEVPENQPQPAGEQSNKAAGTSASGGHDYTFLTDKLFHYKAAVGGGDQSQQLYKDEWIDLIPDGTYKAGKLKEQTHTGTWTYNHETKVLFLKPDDRTFKMSEWKVMYNNQMMVWVGTQTYGNNATQVQLVKSDVLP